MKRNIKNIINTTKLTAVKALTPNPEELKEAWELSTGEQEKQLNLFMLGYAQGMKHYHNWQNDLDYNDLDAILEMCKRASHLDIECSKTDFKRILTLFKELRIEKDNPLAVLFVYAYAQSVLTGEQTINVKTL